jgi:hypothetical protein
VVDVANRANVNVRFLALECTFSHGVERFGLLEV